MRLSCAWEPRGTRLAHMPTAGSVADVGRGPVVAVRLLLLYRRRSFVLALRRRSTRTRLPTLPGACLLLCDTRAYVTRAPIAIELNSPTRSFAFTARVEFSTGPSCRAPRRNAYGENE